MITERHREADDMPDRWQEIDAKRSYNAAIAAIGERVKAGAAIPEFFLPDREVKR